MEKGTIMTLKPIKWTSNTRLGNFSSKWNIPNKAKNDAVNFDPALLMWF